MIAIPLLYFLLLTGYFYRKNGWGLDVASGLLLVAISLFAIVIDVKDLYGIYGNNKLAYNFWTIFLFCLQWTIILLPIHKISALEVKTIDEVKLPSLKIMGIVLFFCSLYLIIFNLEDIKDALILDPSEVRDQHYKNLAKGEKNGFNILALIPTILTSTPFPTIALLLWFYMNSFIKGTHFISIFLLLASIVQAVLGIIIAGRAAMIYWVFDFFLCYSFFYKFLNKEFKRTLNIVGLIFGSIIIVAFVTITVSRYKGTTADRDPLESLYGYAGQHINNFSIMMQEGHTAPFLPDRELPFLSNYILGIKYDMDSHYLKLMGTVKATVSVFDTYGAEIYLDLGIIAYILFHLFILYIANHIEASWKELTFDRILLVGMMTAFFSHGLFAWPFTGHYTSMAIVFILFLVYFFRFRFQLKL